MWGVGGSVCRGGGAGVCGGVGGSVCVEWEVVCVWVEWGQCVWVGGG